MQTLTSTLLGLLVFVLLALPARAEDCTCADAFEQAVKVYENDYALFHIKVTDQNKALYLANTAVYRDKARAVTTIEDCLPVLEQWLAFFRDGHNNIKFTGISGKPHTRERIELDSASFVAGLKKLQKKKVHRRNDLLAIWQYGGDLVGILPNPKSEERQRDYVGVVLKSNSANWRTGDVRFELKQVYGNDYEAVYYQDDNSSRRFKTKLQSPEKLEFLSYNSWHKVWPAANATKSVEELARYSDFHFRMIDGDVPYIRFPNFYEKRPAFVDSLLRAHHQELIKAEFIIIDVRDNNGGDDAVYLPVMPYVLSGPIQIPHIGTWMSESNLKTFLDGKYPEKLDKAGKAEYEYLMSLKNTMFWFNQEKYARTYKPDTLYAPHQKIAVLINGKTISSGETFVYRARQSAKVVLYGQNTAGIVDGFMVLTTRIGCFDLRYPSTLRARDVAEKPIDPYGMAPDVYVSPDADVLEHSIQHMRHLLKKEKTQSSN